ncbi:AfsR/SARP family transcriptional regulator [Saccharothrix longispora]|uniref:AfsR/SARP family transcriptional regulator n=1 Tax=Saccharothrix longispora TaxID=33920 RepID=UPI0028FD3CDB|nr:BTAD domain-containing putative transcriptional regulator [Saccharothrix longispora]MBY8849049.1 tetratricopeptide repeat protein [Saccharothrix sp. MB29]MDU0290685.1 BTAD domain-containing putative transcriptional regulator [Saccharothrix longispora]
MTAEFGVLGPLSVRYSGTPVAVPAGKARVLLASLLLRAGEVVPVDDLVARLWDGGAPDPSRARATLHMTVTRLRQALGAANVVRTAPGGYVAEVAPDALDLHRFRSLVRRARYAEALALWRGEPLSDVRSDVLHAQDVAPLHEERTAVLEHRVEADLAAGAARDLVAELRSLVRLHPLRERLHGQLMLALYRSDRQAEALAAYRAARRVLAAELGVEPGPALRELHERILIANPDLAPAPPPRSEQVAVPHLLPARSPHFVGREDALAELSAHARRTPGPGLVVISGTAGVGKTTVAVHWANQVADSFPDGRLYVNLRGFDPTGEPVPTGEAVRGFLDAFEVPPARIPATTEGQLRLYRDAVGDRRLLIVLDNARDVEQVRPLLPGGSRCFVVVTSRDRLAGLCDTEGAHPLTLDMLDAAEARTLLARRLGRDRLEQDEAATDALVGHCAGLPLALAVVAARAAVNPHFPIGLVVEELADEQDRLDFLDAGDPDASVRNVFSWSYRHLGPAAARLFRLLGRHPGVTLSMPAAAALSGVPLPGAVAAIEELTRAHLLFEHGPDRYSTYDLLRWYAAELSAAEDADADEAADRVLNWYLHTGHRAKRWMTSDYVEPGLPVLDGVRPVEFDSFEAATAWFEAEHLNFVLLARAAADRGRCEYVPQMSAVSWNFLNTRSKWAEILSLGRLGVEAARRLGDAHAETVTRINLSSVCGRLGRFDESIAHSTRCVELSEAHGDDRILRKALNNLGMAHSATGRNDLAVDCLLRALEICHRQEGRPGESILLDTLATIHRADGERERALECLERALDLNLGAGDRYSAGINLANLGLIHLELSDPDAAALALERSLEHSRAVGDRHNEALALTRLGDVRHAAGDTATARRHWRDALVVFRELGAPEMREPGERLLAHGTSVG